MKGKKMKQIKKYDIWWPAYKNDKGEMFPALDATGDEYEYIHNNLRNMLIALEKSGVKEIDFSHWYFEGVIFDESMLSLMQFADKINFSEAYFCGSFKNGQLKNVDFSRTMFDRSEFVNIYICDCNFNKVSFFKKIYFINVCARNCSFDCRFQNLQLENVRISNNEC